MAYPRRPAIQYITGLHIYHDNKCDKFHTIASWQEIATFTGKMGISRWQRVINNIEIKTKVKTCEVCDGAGSFGSLNAACPFCGGTKESTSASRGFVKHHICGCNYTDRKNCPWCKKPCHHDTSMNPRILISPAP